MGKNEMEMIQVKYAILEQIARIRKNNYIKSS